MKSLLILVLLSALGCAVSWYVLALQDGLLVFGPMLIASLILLARRLIQKRRAPILVDGSNVMHWRTGAAEWQPLKDVLAELARRGMRPAVVFDANAGYLLEGRYMYDGDVADKLGINAAQVMVVPKGTAADGYILQAARSAGARIVSNDRFRDWHETFPEAADSTRLLTGQYSGSALILSD